MVLLNINYLTITNKVPHIQNENTLGNIPYFVLIINNTIMVVLEEVEKNICHVNIFFTVSYRELQSTQSIFELQSYVISLYKNVGDGGVILFSWHEL